MPRPKKESKPAWASTRLYGFKKVLHQCRTKLNTVMSLWNIVFSLGVLWFVEWLETDSVGWDVFNVHNSYTTAPSNVTNATIDDEMATNITSESVITIETGMVVNQVSEVHVHQWTFVELSKNTNLKTRSWYPQQRPGIHFQTISKPAQQSVSSRQH